MVVVAAVDRSDRAQHVFDEAATLATEFDVAVHTVHVMTQSDFVEFGRTRAEEGDAVSMEEIREAARNVAEAVVGDADVPVETAGVVGNPADQILAYAREHDAQYIVVSPRKRTPVGKAMFGSVAQSVLLNADVPVVTTVDK